LTYGSDAAASHLTNAFWYLDDGDLLPFDPTAADAKIKGSITRWNRVKQSKEVELFGRIHSDICNVSQYLIPGVRLQIRFTKARSNLYLMNKDAESKVVFKFLNARLYVKRIRPNHTPPLAYNATLAKVALARYNINRVALKSLRFRGITISFHRQRHVGSHTQASPFHHGEEHGLSRLSQHEPVSISQLRSWLFRAYRERQTDAHRGLVSQHGSQEKSVMG